MKLVSKPDYNRSVGALRGTSRGIWKIDGYPLYVCRPVPAPITGSPIMPDGRAQQWIILSDNELAHTDQILVNHWLKVHKLGLHYHYSTRAQALDVLQMALTLDPGFFDGDEQ